MDLLRDLAVINKFRPDLGIDELQRRVAELVVSTEHSFSFLVSDLYRRAASGRDMPWEE